MDSENCDSWTPMYIVIILSGLSRKQLKDKNCLLNCYPLFPRPVGCLIQNQTYPDMLIYQSFWHKKTHFLSNSFLYHSKDHVVHKITILWHILHFLTTYYTVQKYICGHTSESDTENSLPFHILLLTNIQRPQFTPSVASCNISLPFQEKHIL